MSKYGNAAGLVYQFNCFSGGEFFCFKLSDKICKIDKILFQIDIELEEPMRKYWPTGDEDLLSRIKEWVHIKDYLESYKSAPLEEFSSVDLYIYTKLGDIQKYSHKIRSVPPEI